MCKECNIKKGYYPLKDNSWAGNIENYIDCVNDLSKPSNFYFNKENNDYESCYYKCSTCNYGGDGKVNNCSSCEKNFIFKPEILDTTNCVQKCKYFYYYSIFDEYKCTEFEQCPDNYTLLIKEKRKCINICENDNIYINFNIMENVLKNAQIILFMTIINIYVKI